MLFVRTSQDIKTPRKAQKWIVSRCWLDNFLPPIVRGEGDHTRDPVAQNINICSVLTFLSSPGEFSLFRYVPPGFPSHVSLLLSPRLHTALRRRHAGAKDGWNFDSCGDRQWRPPHPSHRVISRTGPHISQASTEEGYVIVWPPLARVELHNVFHDERFSPWNWATSGRSLTNVVGTLFMFRVWDHRP